MRKIPFIVFILIFAVFQVIYLSSWYSSQNETSSHLLTEGSGEEQSQQEQILNDLYLVEARDKSKEWEVWSDKAHKGMGMPAWDLQVVKVKFYSENAVYSVWGKQGVVNEDSRSMLIEGDVKLVSSNDYIFYTQSLSYDPVKRQIVTTDKVSVEGPKEKRGRLYLEGQGLVVNLNTNLMVLQNKVKGHNPMSSRRVMSITSDRVEMSGKTQSAKFKNNVVIKVDEMVVNGNLAEFKYKNNRLDQLVMDGGIHIKDRDKAGTAGTAIVYFNEDKYVFKKSPFMSQRDNEIIGDEITIFDGGKRVQVRNGKAQYNSQEKSK